jgi:DNA-binding transcriptional MocR family regulator
MGQWNPSRVSPRGPVYLAIADSLATAVEEGELGPGERLPTHRDLARRLGVNVVTITRAYAEAARRGLVEGHVGRGTFVRGIEPRGPGLRRVPDDGGAIDLSQNQVALDPAWLDLPALLAALGPRFATSLLGGYLPEGKSEHRAAGATWLRGAGLEVDADQVLVTTGGQQALAALFAAFARPGDTVLVEELTYSGVKSLAALFHLRLSPVAIDEHGIVPDSLEEAARKGNPRFLYCMPNLHNPTGVVLSEERRRAVARLAERYDFLVVEDDASGFLLEVPPPPVAAFAPDRTVFVTSLSKSLSPGLRIGYLAAPCAHLERLHQSQAALTWMTPALTAELASQVIADGSLDRVVSAKRAEVRRRRALFERLLPELASSSHPDAPSVWALLPEPWRGDELVAAAEREGVLVSGAETFVASRASSPHAARFCIGAPSDRAALEVALGRLAGVLGGTPAPSRALV